jgi:OmpA-OmpF porin, OOP family
MVKLPLLTVTVISTILTACVVNPYAKPQGLIFQEETVENSNKIHVKRDGNLCGNDQADQQNCPIEFYIDSFKAGTFYINNQASYQLKSENYNFKVKNCTADSCQSCDVELPVDKKNGHEFTLSVDGITGKPFILNGDQALVCNAQEKVVSTEQTVEVNLAADTLFIFNGASLNDLLPNGYKEVLNVASKISNEFVSVRKIELIGHTDRLGSDSYNQELGQNRANTVRNLLVQNGVAENLLFTESVGKSQPVTNGCFDVKNQEKLKACLQPDRRVVVKITGISK